MATVALTILKHHEKEDGTFNVKIRVTNKNSSTYIDTDHFVTAKQLDKKGKLKDQFILDQMHPTLKNYRAAVAEMENLSAKEIKEKLLRYGLPDEEIDFVTFCNVFIAEKIKAGKKASALTFETVRNNLVDFEGERIPITEITYKFLTRFETYLRGKRKMIRNGQTIIKEGISDSGLHNQMRDLRLIFNAARDHYNDEDKGKYLIKHYPFKKYKVGQAPETGSRKLTVQQVKDIRDSVQPEGSRAELARDLFMLSFYLCGMNAADLYELKPGMVKRVNYNRAKTRGRRKDKAYISIKLIPEAKPLFEKYAGKLQERYVNANGLDAALNKGMNRIAPGVDFYAARYCVGEWARNICRFSKDDVGLALNHKDRSNSTTDIYISKSWDIIDEVQEKVTGLLKA